MTTTRELLLSLDSSANACNPADYFNESTYSLLVAAVEYADGDFYSVATFPDLQNAPKLLDVFTTFSNVNRVSFHCLHLGTSWVPVENLCKFDLTPALSSFPEPRFV